MGIYGYGKAFNLRYVHNSYLPKHTVMRGGCRPVFGGSQTITQNTNIKITNGPTGFWGFLSGLFGGLFGGGMSMGMGMGGFGMGGFSPFGMGMGGFGMGGFSPFGFLNTQMTTPNNQPKTGDRLADLQKMYPDWNITSDGNGKYDAVNKDQTVHHSGNFDEMCEKLLKEKQGAGSTPGSSTPAGSTPESTTPGSSTPASSTPAGSTPASSTPSNSTPASASHATEPQGAGGSSKKVHVPDGWYRADTQSNEGKNLDLKNCTSANAVLEKLLSTKVDYLSNSDRAALCKELIKNNPSVFNADGTVKKNADFDKLDVPSINYIKNKYVGNAKYNKSTGTVTYNSKQGNGVNTDHRNSVMKGAGGRTIKGQNGYYVRTSPSGNKYYDNKGNPISAEEFKHACPNIYASVNKTSATTHKNTTNTTNNTTAANHPANNGKTHVGSRQAWL